MLQINLSTETEANVDWVWWTNDTKPGPGDLVKKRGTTYRLTELQEDGEGAQTWFAAVVHFSAKEWLETYVDWKMVASLLEDATDQIGDSEIEELYAALLPEGVGFKSTIKPQKIKMDPKKMSINDIMALLIAVMVFRELGDLAKEAVEGLLDSVLIPRNPRYAPPDDIGPDGPTMCDAYENETLSLIPCRDMTPKKFLTARSASRPSGIPLEVWRRLLIPSMRNAMCEPEKFDELYILSLKMLREHISEEDEDEYEEASPPHSSRKRKADDECESPASRARTDE